ncbi:uncharacterized protein K452DRAFT_290884 [Aplosporella prunicola CBS 121167]|uniref:Uncharacterized protein n=1 Tax=Aplosporella prunicola CBS 121167 TaxID=1176127 RepID=A0A6A6B285_9PEZI|nr:uncharacterized protein K452DRAFT_290884 [Aplosporella prunicola CBS 121167]KAF2138299.1 hypothetical protein K452DRAFT_290884 [Aplosporella prunicola CBS 121167]
MYLGLVPLVLNLLPTVEALRTSLPIRELRKQIRTDDQLKSRDVDLSALYPAYNLTVPIDHFHNDSLYEPHSNGTFNLRYWFDASHYKKGGPVLLLESGETSGTDRLPFLQKGIIAQLAKATGGIGVILEHRYYGTSFPPVPDLSTQSLRFLTTDQALADTAYFAKNVVFEGLEDQDLTAPNAPWIAYGGSYAGSFVAFLRKLYPDVYWGAISSSGVTEAIYDYWEYFEAHRIYGPQDCIKTTQKLVNVVDNILIGKKDTDYPQQLKDAFGVGNISQDADFASLLATGITYWQNRNWDPAQDDPTFYEFCGNLTSDDALYSPTQDLKSTAQDLIKVGGYGKEVESLTNHLLNYIGYVNVTQISRCDTKKTQDQCFSNLDTTFYAKDDINQTWRSWPYQYCTQWGYLQTGSGVPADILPLVSRLVDLEYASTVCRYAFNITTPSDVEAINKYGGFGISYPRLALIDGEVDPWRQASSHAFAAPNRTSTDSEPFILISGAVHHWDENGLFPNETTATLPPKAVAEAQKAEERFVRKWMQEWQQQQGRAERERERQQQVRLQ